MPGSSSIQPFQIRKETSSANMAVLRLACALLLLFYFEKACAIRDRHVSEVQCNEKLAVAAAKQHFMIEVKKMPATTKALCNWATNGQNPDAREEALTYMRNELESDKHQVTGCTQEMLEKGLDKYCESVKQSKK
ncbi:unnamed protein product [Symbiodinium necroappetens]|uniref:Uncharacterized protein n=1 Tax=Symbiodinium necroappetens TaxID=1628268 RepID=A0A813BIR7_9DINO|nr:unnamed protein product [Symbiodinium necroappetens]